MWYLCMLPISFWGRETKLAALHSCRPSLDPAAAQILELPEMCVGRGVWGACCSDHSSCPGLVPKLHFSPSGPLLGYQTRHDPSTHLCLGAKPSAFPVLLLPAKQAYRAASRAQTIGKGRCSRSASHNLHSPRCQEDIPCGDHSYSPGYISLPNRVLCLTSVTC